MTDIVTRLRAISINPSGHPGLNSKIRDTCSDGADEIERLRAELEAAKSDIAMLIQKEMDRVNFGRKRREEENGDD